MEFPKRSLYKNIIRKVWHTSLLEERKNNEEFNGYRISGIGGCFLKHLYHEKGTPGEIDQDLGLKLNVGTLLHASREKAIEDKKKLLEELCQNRFKEPLVNVYQEIEISDPDKGITGHPDMVFEYENFFDIVDDKFLHTFSWKNTFAQRKEDRDPNAGLRYKMQIINYALILEKMLKIPLRYAIILYGRKNDMFQREMLVNRKEIEPLVHKYWDDLEKCKKDDKDFGVIPGIAEGCPFESWECKGCKWQSNCFPEGI